MKLILTENIRGLGSTGDIVKVRDGFARNYLLPKRLATFPTEDNAKKYKKEREHYLVREKGNIEAARMIAEKLKGFHLTIRMKANDAGHLFGSVTESIVAENLAAAIGHPIEPKAVILGSHKKHIGDYTVIVRLHSEVEEEIDLTVVAEAAGEPDGKEAAAPAKAEAPAPTAG